MRRLRYAVLLLALPLTAACGAGSDAADPSPQATTSATAGLPTGAPGSTSVPGANATPTPGPVSPDPTSTSAARARPISIVGTVSVQQGQCLLFTPGDMAESWVLSGAIEGLTPGEGYTLEGVMDDTPDKDCPQGPTFIVTSAAPTS